MEIELKHKDEFVRALKNYRPSDTTISALHDMPLVILLSVTGGGRNTIINQLVLTGRYHYIVSDTTRPPKFRDGAYERDGEIYHFRGEEAILEDIRRGMYLEAELIHGQQVSGMNVSELARAEKSGKVPISEVDMGGTEAIATVKPNTLFLFIVPPSYDEWMRRLRTREEMSESELLKRLQTAFTMLNTVIDSERFVFVVNDDLGEVVKTVDDYVKGEIHRTHDNHARTIATQLVKDIAANYPDLT